MNCQKTRGSHRTRKQGSAPEHTKPSKAAKHLRSTGGRASVLAGATGNRVVVWEHLKGPWNGEVAAEAYKGVIKKTLQKHRPGKQRHKICDEFG